MDRRGRVFSDEECRVELEAYKDKSPRYKKLNMRPGKVRTFFYTIDVYKRQVCECGF